MQIIKIMQTLNKMEGVTFVFSTHDPRLFEIADRKIELRDGKVVKDVVQNGNQK